ncbi:MAG: glycosyltransferase family 39 protein, partial [Candidatus Omnitrophica bacterium]|nr:glycosyltransferase family 39 protein [Candidatus Omnitrophota bacterium]
MLQNKKSRLFLIVVMVAIIIKLSLFAFVAFYAPQGKMLSDSYGYLNLSDRLAQGWVFTAQSGSGYEIFRTPGYPLFLAIFHGLIRISLDGIVLIQIAMTLLVAFITYKVAQMVAPGIAFLSAIIILYDPPITIYSLAILSEALFLLLIALFMLSFVLYLKHKKIGYIVLSAFILAVAAYVRPVAYYLGFIISFFTLYANRRENLWKSLKDALIFLAVMYFIIGLWETRNYIFFHDFVFCRSDKYNLDKVGLFKSYARNMDPYTKGMAPLPYYINVTFRSLTSLMTRPGNFKYFKFTPLTIGGLIIGYPWMVFWLSGFIMGAIRSGRNIYIQFMLFVTLYFIFASVVGQM